MNRGLVLAHKDVIFPFRLVAGLAHVTTLTLPASPSKLIPAYCCLDIMWVIYETTRSYTMDVNHFILFILAQEIAHLVMICAVGIELFCSYPHTQTKEQGLKQHPDHGYNHGPISQEQWGKDLGRTFSF